jgi:hypothetical protein
MNRTEHLNWAKQRALEHVEHGELFDAIASMASDLRKHPELANHVGLDLMIRLQLSGHLNTPERVRKIIEGFN